MKKRRVVLKLSGETLANAGGKGYDEAVVRDAARQVKRSVDAGVEVDIVIGGGNYWRGRAGTEIARMRTGQIGILATAMNCVYVSEIFCSEGMETEIFSPSPCGAMIELSSVDRANALFAAGRVFLFAGDTGHPYFSTDTGIALRATEPGVDEILLAKSVDGVYTADSKFGPDVEHYGTLTIQEMVDKKSGVIDLTAGIFCMGNKIPFVIFNLHDDNTIADALRGMIHDIMVTV